MVNFAAMWARFFGICVGSVVWSCWKGPLRPDQVHMCLKVAPKFSIAFVIGFLKGKSAVRIHRELMQARRVKGLHFWSRGYCVSTVGLDERTVRAYIRQQEEQEKRQLDLQLE